MMNGMEVDYQNVCICLHVCVCVSACMRVHVWRAWGTL